MLFISWFILSIIVALLGDNKKIGIWAAFFISLIFSPLIGLIVVLVSDRKYPQKVVIQNPVKKPSAADEISKLKSLLDDGALTQEEFDDQKAKILG